MTRNEILKIIDEEIINKDENIDVDKLDEYLQLFETTVKILKIFKRKDELNFIKNVYNEISKKNNDFEYYRNKSIISNLANNDFSHSIFKYYEKLKVWNVLEIYLEKENSKLLFGIIPEGSDAIVLDKLRNNKTKFQNLFNNMELKNTESYLYCWYIDAERCNDNDYAKEIADNILKLDNILNNL
ncbi:hypothetical protein [Brachyspira innocens]|uniref:hypothetical protein n=1 Tax=Brachyspira innocens TaxID=13264 RepID=UPI0026ECDD87|nr:hypothetical protein [Brachyspira innocens]